MYIVSPQLVNVGSVNNIIQSVPIVRKPAERPIRRAEYSNNVKLLIKTFNHIEEKLRKT